MRFACALLVVFFPFAIVGMQAFAGTVSKCDASCGAEYSLVAGSEGYYQLNSFDNVGRAYVTLFELMIVNNWHLIMEVRLSLFRRIANTHISVRATFQRRPKLHDCSSFASIS
jgi:hypothetical protein